MHIKKQVSFLLAFILAVGLITVPAGAATNYTQAVAGQTQLSNAALNKASMSAQDIQALDETVNDRPEGLIGFEGIDLTSDEDISVIIEFNNLPAAVASTIAKYSNATVHTDSYYQNLVASDKATFATSMGKLGIPYSLRDIRFDFNVAISGVSMDVPANRVEDLLTIDSVYAVYYNATQSIGPPVDDTEAVSDAIDSLTATADAAALDGGGPYIDYDSRSWLGADVLDGEGVRGAGVLVGIIDTGVDYLHPDLIDSFLDYVPAGSDGSMRTVTVNGTQYTKYFGMNFILDSAYPLCPSRDANDPFETSPNDWLGTGYARTDSNSNTFYTEHGTHCAGAIVGRGAADFRGAGVAPARGTGTTNTMSDRGVAPEANLVMYRALGPYGSGATDGIVKAMEQTAIDGCNVVSMSLGADSGGPYDLDSTVANYLTLTYGIVFCLAAGNAGGTAQTYNSTVGSPGAASLAITVAATSVGTQSTTANQNVVTVTPAGTSTGTSFRWYYSNYNGPIFRANTAVPGTYNFPANYYGYKLNDPDTAGNYDYCIVPTAGGDPNVPGAGTAADFAAVKDQLAGKIGVVSAGTTAAITTAATNALASGCLAIVVLSTATATNSLTFQANRTYCETFVVSSTDTAAFLANLTAGGMKAAFTSISGITRSVGSLASFSSRGPNKTTYEIKPDITTPGAPTYSTAPYWVGVFNSPYTTAITWPANYSYTTAAQRPKYQSMQGTSMATPQMAGLAALMLGANKAANDGVITMTPAELKAKFMNTADRTELGATTTNYSVMDIGAGRPNILRAIQEEAYITVEFDNVACRTSDTQYDIISSDTASFSFGAFSCDQGTAGVPFVKTMTATIHNESDQTRTYTLSNTWNNFTIATNRCKPVGTTGITLSIGSPTVVVAPGATSTFDVTMTIPSLLGASAEGGYEGYLYATDDQGNKYSLPYEVWLRQTIPVIANAYMAKPVIAGGMQSAAFAGVGAPSRTGNAVSGSMSDTLFLTFGRATGSTAIYYVPYVTKVSDFDPSKPSASFLGHFANTDAVAVTNLAAGSSATIQNAVYPYFNEFNSPGDYGGYTDEYSYLDQGEYILTVNITKDNSGFGPDAENMASFPIYVDYNAPQVTVAEANAADKVISGTVYDQGTRDMEALGLTYDYAGVPASMAQVEIVAVVDNTYYAEANVDESGTFSIDLSSLRLLTEPRTAAPTTTYAITDATQIKLYALNGFERVPGNGTGWSATNTSLGFNPAGGSFRTMNGTAIVDAYTGCNTVSYAFSMGAAPSVSLADYEGLAMTPGGSKTLYPVLDDKAKAFNVTWESSDPSVATVSEDGTINAVSAGTTVISAISGGARYDLDLLVTDAAEAIDVSAGVNLTAGDYIYMGAINHPAALTATANTASNTTLNATTVTSWDGYESPILWKVMGQETLAGGGTDGFLTLYSKYILNASMFATNGYSAHYNQSYLAKWLNTDFLRSFKSSEDNAIPSFDVTTGYYSSPTAESDKSSGYLFFDYAAADYAATGQKAYLPWAMAYNTAANGTMSSAVNLYWSAADYDVNNMIPTGDRASTSKTTATVAWQWSRSKAMLPDFAVAYAHNNSIGPNPTGVKLTETLTTNSEGIRPLTKITPEDIVYAYPITANAVQPDQPKASIQADATNYRLPSDIAGSNVYKLTLLGSGNGASVGTVSYTFSSDSDFEKLSDISATFADPNADPSDYCIAYKLLDENGAIIYYAEAPADTMGIGISNMEVGLSEGDSGSLYVWLQKNNDINSNEAGVVTRNDFTVPSPLSTYTITVSAAASGSAADDSALGDGVYTEGDEATVTATPDANCIFTGWYEDGVLVSTDNPYTFTVTGDRTLVAKFLDMKYDINSDGKVDSNDLTILMANLNKKASTNAVTKKCDLDGDGIVTANDYAILAAYIASLN